MARVGTLAERTGATVLLFRHLRESGGTDAIYRGIGSVALNAIARASLMLLKAPPYDRDGTPRKYPQAKVDMDVDSIPAAMSSPTTKEKGDLLEDVITGICSGLGLKDSKITRNAQIDGRHSRTKRDVDVLIEGRLNAFEVRIAIEAKNYQDRVGVEKVEAFHTKLDDIGVNLGVMVSSKGFTHPAKDTAAARDVQLFEVYDQRLENTSLLLPVRHIAPDVAGYQVELRHQAGGPFSIPADWSQWRFRVGDKQLTIEELLYRALPRVPPTPGIHEVDVGAVTIVDVSHPGKVQYCEIGFKVAIRERYYLKLFPASFIKNAANGAEQHSLKVDMYHEAEQLTANGWREFATREEMEQAADIPNQPEAIRNLAVVARAPSETE